MQSVPFLMVRNLEISLDFYCKGLGFKMTNKWEPRGRVEWSWLQLGNACLMLQEYRDVDPPENQGAGVSIYFMCDDALKIWEELMSHGITVEEPFVGNRFWVVPLTDPDGYNIVFESPADEAEGTRFYDWIRS